MARLNEETDPGHLGLLKETLRVIFGLEPKTIGKVLAAIKSSEDAADVKTNIIRSRIGARAMKFLRNAIEIARHEGTEKHDTEKERDLQKDEDLGPEQLAKEKKRKTQSKKTNESFTFVDYLINEREVTISVDPEDPASAKKAITMAQRDPERSNRISTAAAKDARAAAQKEGDPIAAKIAALRMQIKQLEARQARQQGTE